MRTLSQVRQPPEPASQLDGEERWEEVGSKRVGTPTQSGKRRHADKEAGFRDALYAHRGGEAVARVDPANPGSRDGGAQAEQSWAVAALLHTRTGAAVQGGLEFTERARDGQRGRRRQRLHTCQVTRQLACQATMCCLLSSGTRAEAHDGRTLARARQPGLSRRRRREPSQVAAGRGAS